MKNIIIILTTVITALLVNNPVFAQQATRTAQFNLKNNMAIQGYDPVAYFSQRKAIKGKKEFAVSTEGITYHFTSAENKELFKKDYRKYEPQYGGWCAYAMGATNDKVDIDPETFKIVGGKLYLFYHSWTNNTLAKWNKDEAKLRSLADASWTKFFK